MLIVPSVQNNCNKLINKHILIRMESVQPLPLSFMGHSQNLQNAVAVQTWKKKWTCTMSEISGFMVKLGGQMEPSMRKIALLMA